MSQFRVDMAKLEQANEAKDHFLAVLSHELRTPLTPVLLIAESLETNPLLNETIKEDIALIKRNITLEVRLIDDLLDVTKISKGKLELHMEEISVHEVLVYSLQLLEHDIVEKSLKTHQYKEASEDYIMGDPSRIQQILWNIIKVNFFLRNIDFFRMRLNLLQIMEKLRFVQKRAKMAKLWWKLQTLEKELSQSLCQEYLLRLSKKNRVGNLED